MQTNQGHQKEVIGLIPASGQAKRLSPLPCSKELYPIGFRRVHQGTSFRPKVVCHYLLEKMRSAGIAKAYIVLRSGKWDIPAYLGDGRMLNMHMAYLMMDLTFGVPYTIDQAYPFIQNAIVAFGFPDILFEPADAYVRLLKRLNDTTADIVLGLFPVDQPEKWDMVDVDEKNRIRQVLIKPLETRLRYSWIIAAWTPVFTHFLHNYVAARQGVEGQSGSESNTLEQEELFLSDVIQAAIRENLLIEGVPFTGGCCLDIGTPEDLVKALSGMNSNNKFDL